MRARQAKAEATGKKPRGRAPKPPEQGPRDKDQYNFTDPDSRIMKNSTDQGFDQHYNAQVAVDHESLLVVGCRVSDQANDKKEAIPTLDAIPSEVGKPASASLDNGYFSEGNIEEIEAREIEAREIEPYIATGREGHAKSWDAYFAAAPDALPRRLRRKRRWPISSRPKWARRSTVCANARSSRCWVLSRRCWGSDSFCSGVWRWWRGSGRWSAWVST